MLYLLHISELHYIITRKCNAESMFSSSQMTHLLNISSCCLTASFTYIFSPSDGFLSPPFVSFLFPVNNPYLLTHSCLACLQFSHPKVVIISKLYYLPLILPVSFLSYSMFFCSVPFSL